MDRAMNGGLHVGLIMDGNGRWACARGLPRTEGHRRGADAVRRAVEAAPDLGIATLTLYAFSADNWRRPAAEVSTLMRLLQSFLVRERTRCRRHGVRLALIGRRDRLSPALVRAIEETERATRGGVRLYLRLAVDYSARHSILAAAGTLGSDERCDEDGFLRRINRACHSDPATPPVDLV
ncbi:MAG: polyprenyl diphosphate synthase, partial [Acidobacteriota bacterium]|nr:polyprenyl diphosphate synthase [Acidobacteriota bacterium]